jgi:uncharacterized damage-inducible protein DinB
VNDKPMFTTFWTNESSTTCKVLARIPEGSDYRPDPKSRTAQQIAWAIVCEEKMIIEALESGKVEWAPLPMAWSFLFDIVHHRGQICTYLRPMGATVPQIYGPSGDEP